jgi:voltage-gated potassium channel
VRAVASIYRAMGIPLFHRVGWHLRRVAQNLDARSTLALGGSLVGVVLLAAFLVTWIEGPLELAKFGEAIYWAINTLLGTGDPSYVSTFSGRLINAALIVTSLTFLAVITGLVIGFIIDVMLKEGQGLGVAGMSGHVVVCGWNDTAREVLVELQEDNQVRQVVLLADLESAPAGARAHFVRGDPTVQEDLERAGIREAASAIVLPDDAADEADMRSILIVMAIKEMAPHVRAAVEASSPRNIPHLKRAHADEVIATPQFVAHLLARSSVHAGLVDLVMDMVTGGEGSELYRIPIPGDLADRAVGDAGPALRADHRAVLVAVIREGRNIVNPPGDLILDPKDELLVLAESLDSLDR